MYHSVFILGRQPALGRAELESLFEATQVQPAGDQAMLCTVPANDIPFSRLGGSLRAGRVLAELPAAPWPELSRQLGKQLPALLKALPEGKVKLGISCFGIRVTSQQLFRAGLELKKVCKAAGRSVRLVPHAENDVTLSSAQVLHNHLAGELGIELLLIQDGNHIWLAQTTEVQDITAYARRDQNRPKRDARVGMLPPKLAQLIVNLATAATNPHHGAVVLDPFCGTGVVLQEAILMGFGVYGSDLEARMVEYTDHNLQWLRQNIQTPVTHVHSPDGRYFRLEVGDATTHHWQPTPNIVACETYLGRPLSGWPTPEKLQDIVSTCNVIIEKFIRNITAQLPSNTRLCLAVPAWQAPTGRIHHLPLIDHLTDLGYNRVSFEHTQASELLYSRPDQIVARELLVITRK